MVFHTLLGTILVGRALKRCGLGYLLSCGVSPGLHFNYSRTVFAPKGDSPDDLVGSCVRAPLDTRPLSLKNSDNKCTAAVHNMSLAKVLECGIASSQRGFIQNRNFLDNVVELDTASRIYAMDPSHDTPCMGYFRFGDGVPFCVP